MSGNGPAETPPKRVFAPDLLTELFRNPLDPGYADAAARKAVEGEPTGPRKWVGSGVLAVTLVALGFLLVVAYQPAPRQQLEYGAIATIGLPRTVQVHDGQACPLPKHSDLWPLISDSCISENGQIAIPIVNTTRLFSQVWD